MLNRFYPEFRHQSLCSVTAGVLISCLLAGCSSLSTKSSLETKDGPPENPKSVAHVKNAVPKLEPKSKYGNPPSYVVFGKTYYVMESSKDYKAKGLASWYGTKFHGKRTSSGEPYDLYAMTAAHKTLPLPTYAKVKNLDNGKEIIVKINDRGPFVDDRLIDLSYAAAQKLGIYGTGTGHVQVTALDPRTYGQPEAPVYNINGPQNAQPMYMQLGAFKDKQNAEKLANQLQLIAQADKLEIKIHETKVADSQWYKVRFGPIFSQEQFAKVEKKILEKNLPAPTVVFH